MRACVFSILIGAVVALPAFAAGGHGGGGFGGSRGMGLGHSSTGMGHMTQPNTHGASVSAAAHDAKLSGGKVGPQVRDVARSKSQGPAHANSHAIDAVNGTHGNAAANSVLGNGGGTSTAKSSNGVKNGHSH